MVDIAKHVKASVSGWYVRQGAVRTKKLARQRLILFMCHFCVQSLIGSVLQQLMPLTSVVHRVQPLSSLI